MKRKSRKNQRAIPLDPRGRTWFVAALLFALTLGVFWPATGCDFVNFDEGGYGTANPYVAPGNARARAAIQAALEPKRTTSAGK